MSQSSGYQYPVYPEPNNSLKNDPSPIMNGQNSASQQNGVQSPQFNLTGKFLPKAYMVKKLYISSIIHQLSSQ